MGSHHSLLGVLVNLGLMAGLGSITWAAFLIWMALGLVIYFSYTRHVSLVQTAGRAIRLLTNTRGGTFGLIRIVN
ncbi:MAG: hypothetical protein JOY85_15265 [Acidobacteriaceae bacterium]|nr:hypothetical protein [Acidobacteriaceae bacterium]